MSLPTKPGVNKQIFQYDKMPRLRHGKAAKAWITTYTGQQFFLLKPILDTINIEDIAHALANQCRWTGHTRFHYSVAQHCFYCSYLVPPADRLAALLHDASEAYMGDMNRPLKHYTACGPAYRRQEAVLMNLIYLKFGLPNVEPESVKIADDSMLYAEKEQLINPATTNVYEKYKWGCSDTAAAVVINQWSPEFAKFMFLRRFAELKEAA